VDCFAFLKGLGTTPIETAWLCGSIALRQQPERLIQEEGSVPKTDMAIYVDPTMLDVYVAQVG
jgi:hypothetical protein